MIPTIQYVLGSYFQEENAAAKCGQQAAALFLRGSPALAGPPSAPGENVATGSYGSASDLYVSTMREAYLQLSPREGPESTRETSFHCERETPSHRQNQTSSEAQGRRVSLPNDVGDALRDPRQACKPAECGDRQSAAPVSIPSGLGQHSSLRAGRHRVAFPSRSGGWRNVVENETPVCPRSRPLRCRKKVSPPAQRRSDRLQAIVQAGPKRRAQRLSFLACGSPTGR